MEVHATRSGHAGNPDEGIGTVNYCLTPGTTSYNDIIDLDGTIYHLSDEATWHGEEYNYNWWSIGMAQAVVGDRLTDAQHQALRWRIAERCQHFEIPRRWLPSVTGPKSARGVVEHMNTDQGKRWGKSDVGYQLNRDYAIGATATL